MANTTDVRAWAREQGYEIGSRGGIPGDIKQAYEDAHHPKIIPGEVLPPEPGAPTDADFYPGVDDPDPGDPDGAVTTARPPSSPPPPPPGRETGERAPRRPARAKRAGLFARARNRPGRRKRGGRDKLPRVSLGDFAEETWQDLAWLAQPIPPLAAMLELQAPYAGVVLDEQVRGTVVDDFLQPVARYAGLYRALNGLLGPPIAVLMICADGRIDPDTGKPDTRTNMMLGLLRYSLLQMLKVSELSAPEIETRTQAMAERHAAVDAIMVRLGFMEPPGPPSPPPTPPSPGEGGPIPRSVHVSPAMHFRYPDTPAMDDTGADPARMLALPADAMTTPPPAPGKVAGGGFAWAGGSYTRPLTMGG